MALIEKPFSPGSLLALIAGRLDRRAPAAAESPMVLVVDDDPAVREFACSVLQAQGYRVAAAENALVALHILKNTRCGLVITDVVMPHKDGVELAVEIARDYPECKLILMSGAAPPQQYFGAVPNLKAGVVLEKPFDAAMLQQTVAAVLRERS